MTYLSAQAFVDRTQGIAPNELIDLLDGAKTVLGALGKQYTLAPVRDAVAKDHATIASMIDLLIATRNATPKAINAIIQRVQQREGYVSRVRIVAPATTGEQLDSAMTHPHRTPQMSETDDGITVMSDDGVYHRRWQDDVRTLLR